MTRDSDSGHSRPGRRAFLSLSAATAITSLTGCLDRLPGTGPETVDGDALAEMVSDDPPTVPRTLPVEIESSFIEDQRAAARAKLDDIPAPFDESAIPNGVIRERLNEEYESARESIRRISEAPTPYERLGRASRARTSAHGVLTAWRAIDGEVTAATLRESRSAVGDDVDAFVERWTYVGDDPVRAAVVHAEIEGEIRGARNWLSDRRDELAAAGGQSLRLAEVGTDIERARVGVAVASHLLERLRERVAGNTGASDVPDCRAELAAAGDELRERVRTQSDGLPGEDVEDPTSLVDRDIGTTAGVRALEQLGRHGYYQVQDALKTGGGESGSSGESGPQLATASLTAARVLTYCRAFEQLRDRIDSGDDVAVASVDDVRAFRNGAFEAIETARTTDRGRTVGDAILPTFANELRWTEGRFEDRSGSVRVESVSRDAAEYVVVAETCRAVPAVSAAVESALRQS